MTVACVILAAGQGTRMKSSLPKVLHKIWGRTMLDYVVAAAKKLAPEKIIVVAGRDMDLLKASLKSQSIESEFQKSGPKKSESMKSAPVSFVLQKEAKGTGHALLCARADLQNFKGDIVVLNGDAPLINPAGIKKFLRLHRTGKNSLSVLSFTTEKPFGYGRILRDKSGSVLSIIEEKDADKARKLICEVNSGVYAIKASALGLLDGIRLNKVKGEYYLTDIVAAAADNNLRPAAYCIGREEEFLGVNTRSELARAAGLMRRNIIGNLTDKGAHFIDCGSVYIGADVIVGKETTIYPNVCIEGRTKIGEGSTVYPNVRILDCKIGKGVVIKDSTVMEGSTVDDRAVVGPFAHIRPGSTIGSDAKVGNFVELKKTVMGKASKASHLSYLGDTSIGRSVNIGAGTITCNYDGILKNRTVIEDGVFVGSDSQLVAPVTVGKGAYIGAGSTITRDVPPGALAVSRTAQKNIDGWAAKKKKSR